MRFDLTAPCKTCPFRVGGRTTRVSDARQIASVLDPKHYDYSQTCHEHSHKSEKNQQYCIGAMQSLQQRGQSTRTIDEFLWSNGTFAGLIWFIYQVKCVRVI